MFLPHPKIEPKITHSKRISPSRTGSALKGGMVPFFQYRESFRFWERCFFLKTVVFLFFIDCWKLLCQKSAWLSFIDCWKLLCQKSAWLSRFRALFASKMAIVGFSGLGLYEPELHEPWARGNPFPESHPASSSLDSSLLKSSPSHSWSILANSEERVVALPSLHHLESFLHFPQSFYLF